ncbi:MAG TPA: MFS transporter, partial [Phenylobacterium sp.]|nr:MFS transporter [Phenylobacterium sp.]
AWLPAIALAVSVPLWIGLLWAPSWQLTLLFMAGPMLLNSVYLAPVLAIVQNAAAPSERTMAGAILLFVLNLVGLGVGPVYVGRIADAVAPAQGHNALAVGYAALVPIVVVTVGAYLVLAMSIARDKRLAALVG